MMNEEATVDEETAIKPKKEEPEDSDDEKKDYGCLADAKIDVNYLSNLLTLRNYKDPKNNLI